MSIKTRLASPWRDLPPRSVEVLSPENRQVAAFDAFPQTEPEIAFLLRGISGIKDDERLIVALKRVQSEFRETAYGRWAQFLLAQHLLSNAFWKGGGPY